MTKFRGYDIYFDGIKFRYKDNNQPVAETWKDRPCGFCGEHNTSEGYDACIGKLPDEVMNACCGHGEMNEAYIQFKNGRIITGKSALNYVENLRKI